VCPRRPHFLGGTAGGGGINTLGGFGGRAKTVISAPAEISVAKEDNDEDIFAKLKKMEQDHKREKKEAKEARKRLKTSMTPSSVTSSSSLAARMEPPQTQALPVATVSRPPGFNPFKVSLGDLCHSVLILSLQPVSSTPTPVSAVMRDDVLRKAKKQKRMVRAGGGQVWEDESLKDWDQSDFRLFCGDLGNDVTDELLARTFGRYPSFQRAKVIRDKRTSKTKGFGFVSFKDPADFTRAVKDLNGKYVGSRPIKLKKSNWRDRNIEEIKKKQKQKQKMGYKW